MTFRTPSHAFGCARTEQVSASLIARLMQGVCCYGVSQEFVKRVLENVSTDDLIHAIRLLMNDEKRMEQVAIDSSFHPNGFIKIQFHIQGETKTKIRLHYWPANAHTAEENVHNHRWRMASKVMMGSLHSETWVPLDNMDVQDVKNAQRLTLRMYHKQLGAYGATEKNMGMVWATCTDNVHQAAGMAYYMHEDTMHRIVQPTSNTPTLTLMVQSAPIYQDNHMLSFPHVKQPELCAKKIETVACLKKILEEIVAGLIEQSKQEKETTLSAVQNPLVQQCVDNKIIGEKR